jgi:hypothetical protein
MRRVVALLALVAAAFALVECRRPPVRGRVLALSLAVFSKDAAGRATPGHATAGFLEPATAAWRHGSLIDPGSNVFHKLLEYCPSPGECGLPRRLRRPHRPRPRRHPGQPRGRAPRPVRPPGVRDLFLTLRKD